MAAERRLLLASVLFAVLWTLGMIWWTGIETANAVALSIAGVVVERSGTLRCAGGCAAACAPDAADRRRQIRAPKFWHELVFSYC
jgi:hypothetical protein